MANTGLGNKLKNLFRQYDTNGDGTIDMQELKQVVMAISSDFSEDEIMQVFVGMDCNRDGKIQYDEFVDWVTDDTLSFENVCNPTKSVTKRNAKMQVALLKGLPEGVRAALLDEVQLEDFTGIRLDFTGEEPDFDTVVSGLQLLDAKALRSAYEEADLDKNGYLQLDELRKLLFPMGAAFHDGSTALAKSFAQMDKNNDGKVRCSEFVSYILQTKKLLSSVPTDADKRQIAEAFEKADTDKGGSVSLSEFQVLLGTNTEEEKLLVRKAFETLDTNHDNCLSVVEFSRVYGKELLQTSKVTEAMWAELEDDGDEEDD
mmetsp:Transcript_89653/g.141540  ORF Transcript_89653/g.141540 Transcript_89653/m.141540 type:complete len:316 (-) Transcript_89653:41-988(-)